MSLIVPRGGEGLSPDQRARALRVFNLIEPILRKQKLGRSHAIRTALFANPALPSAVTLHRLLRDYQYRGLAALANCHEAAVEIKEDEARQFQFLVKQLLLDDIETLARLMSGPRGAKPKARRIRQLIARLRLDVDS